MSKFKIIQSKQSGRSSRAKFRKIEFNTSEELINYLTSNGVNCTDGYVTFNTSHKRNIESFILDSLNLKSYQKLYIKIISLRNKIKEIIGI